MDNSKKILGLDIGTNSIGWALIEHDFKNKVGQILGCGSRIIPMDEKAIGEFNKGVLQSEMASRRGHRGMRRMYDRARKRRDRLVKVLKIIGFMDQNFHINPFHSYGYIRQEDKIESRFNQSYKEMEEEFGLLYPDKKGVPYDWTIYYLRKKALREKVSKDELAWIILQFCTKRGYYKTRGNSEATPDTSKTFVSDRVLSITDTGAALRGTKVFEVELAEGIIGEYKSKERPDWQGRVVEFIMTEKTLKDGRVSVTFSQPGEDDWTLRKKRTESILENEGKHPGEYIYDSLLKNPQEKIRGSLVHTIDRKLYRNELLEILHTQKKYHVELESKNLLKESALALYQRNEGHRKNLEKQSVIELIVDDIIYYQRPLKSKKYLIANCKEEKYYYKKAGALETKPIKAIPKSHPLFHEYRIWGLIHNLKVIEREVKSADGRLIVNADMTKVHLDFGNKAKVYDLFIKKQKIKESDFIKCLGLKPKEYRWNYEPDTIMEGHKTYIDIYKCLTEEDQNKLNDQKLEKIWHILYSLSSELEYTRNALSSEKIDLQPKSVEALMNISSYELSYGAYSKKAISKLLSLMRCGKYWDKNRIVKKVSERIDKIIDGEYDENVSIKVREACNQLKLIEDFQGLPQWLASYVVYNRHSEMNHLARYTSTDQIDINQLIPQGALRNPTVEKVIRETILVTRDIWKEYGTIDEIHLELAREIKSNAKTRSRYIQSRNDNYNANQRAKAILQELHKENARINPYSKGHQETIRLYEEGALANAKDLNKDIQAISRKGEPSKKEIEKYRLWLDQKYISPYTGQIIPLSQLFDVGKYEIEHIIPKSLFYDNSFANKIICERLANQKKGNDTAYQAIMKYGGQPIDHSSQICFLSKDEYEQHIATHFRGKKKQYLLSENVPEGFISRQLNDTRYISRKLMEYLDPFVREENEDHGALTRNLITMPGAITNELKHQWGLHDVWKELIAPRFKRLNEIKGTDEFYRKDEKGIHLSGCEGDIKRIDHRHHALDALVIACCTRNHINYLSALNNDKVKQNLRPQLMKKDRLGNWSRWQKPWSTFTQDSKNILENVIISFKYNHRIINKSTNFYQKYIEVDGEWKKRYVKQKKSNAHWSIRQALHKETVNGTFLQKVLKEVPINKALSSLETINSEKIKNALNKRIVECNGDLKKTKKSLKNQPLIIKGEEIKMVTVFHMEPKSTSRAELNEKLTLKTLQKVMDVGLRRQLEKHLEKYDNDPKVAFDPNGVIEFNRHRVVQVQKLKVFEDLGKKFPLSEEGVNSKKYVETAEGTNLFFAVDKNIDTGEITNDKNSTLALKDIIEIMIDQPDDNVVSKVEDLESYLEKKILMPGDLVFVTFNNSENLWTKKNLEDINTNGRIYRMVSCTKGECHFRPMHVATRIIKNEIGTNDKSEKILKHLLFDWESSEFVGQIMIKRNFLKLKVNRLGKIIALD